MTTVASGNHHRRQSRAGMLETLAPEPKIPLPKMPRIQGKTAVHSVE
jgi:hypothetical protein